MLDIKNNSIYCIHFTDCNQVQNGNTMNLMLFWFMTKLKKTVKTFPKSGRKYKTA